MKATGEALRFGPGSGRGADGKIFGTPILVPAQPVDTFAIPPLPPKPVAEADENFRRLAAEYRDVQSQLSEAFELREHEIGEAHASASQARVAKSAPPAKGPNQVAAEWDVKLDALRSEQAILSDAVDQAGDTLLDAIATHKSDWIDAFIKQDLKQTKALREAVAKVEACIADLRHARSAPEWLRTFSPSHTVGSNPTPYPGGKLHANLGSLRDLANPPRRLRYYRKQQPLYERWIHGEWKLEWADGSPVEPEIVREVRDVVQVGRS